MKITIAQAKKELSERRDRSAWHKGVTLYAFDLLDNLSEAIAYNNRDPESRTEAKEWMLNGARDWGQFSYDGSALIYDGDIAERLCTPSELKKTRNGECRPNARENWLDCQARALFQASARVLRMIF